MYVVGADHPHKGAGGRRLHVWDEKSGTLPLDYKLPSMAGAHPMSYMIDGRQYIALAVGAAAEPAELVALALP